VKQRKHGREEWTSAADTNHRALANVQRLASKRLGLLQALWVAVADDDDCSAEQLTRHGARESHGASASDVHRRAGTHASRHCAVESRRQNVRAASTHTRTHAHAHTTLERAHKHKLLTPTRDTDTATPRYFAIVQQSQGLDVVHRLRLVRETERVEVGVGHHGVLALTANPAALRER
jgi:hypothetical protein